MRKFNVTGTCWHNKHYMVDTSEKIAQIMRLVEAGDYFTINRGRQYGKTTTLWLLDDELVKYGYVVAHISFEGIGDTPFENEENFCLNIIDQIYCELKRREVENHELWNDNSITTFKKLDAFLNVACKDKKLVLMIDETDKTSNNLIFLRFVGMLRNKYLERGSAGRFTFQSVILAGVYNIKNLICLNQDWQQENNLEAAQSLRLVSQDYRINRIVKKNVEVSGESLNRENRGSDNWEKRINSPWNIAVDFEVDMSFSAKEIATMLNEYEKDYKTGMDIEAVSKEIRAYTRGYPYLVSRICQKMDEKLDKDWTVNGVHEAIKIIFNEPNLLFDDLGKNLDNNELLSNLLYDITINGTSYDYNMTDYAIDLGFTFGFLRNENGKAVIDNLIFETVIYNHFITKNKIRGIDVSRVLPEEVIEDKKFNMEFAIQRFAECYYEFYSESRKKFLESECRILFLTYIKPLINGVGFCHVESQTRNIKRTDVIIDYNTEQFIIELKLWYGEKKHEEAYEQLFGYLESKNKNVGYLLTFDFRREENIGKPKMKWVEYKGKKIFDVMVGM